MERMGILDNYYGEGKSIRDKITELEEENKKLKKEKGNIRQRLVALEKELETLSRVKENKELIKENKKLKKELGEYKKIFEDKLKDGYIKNTAEFLDKKFPKVNGFMEEDTLQELRDLGEI